MTAEEVSYAMTDNGYVLRMCACGTETVYARGMGQRCYRRWWQDTKAVIVHGSKGRGYNYGCRCDDCLAAAAKAQREHQARKRANS